MSQISSGLGSLSSRGIGSIFSRGDTRHDFGTGATMEGFGSDSMAFGGSEGSKTEFDPEDHGLGAVSISSASYSKYSSSGKNLSSKSLKKKTSGLRIKGLKLGKKSKESDELLRDAMEADELIMTTSVASALRDLKIKAEARATGATVRGITDSGSSTDTHAGLVTSGGRSGPIADVEIDCSERFEIVLDREGVLKKYEIRGDFEIAVNNPDCGQCIVVIDNKRSGGLLTPILEKTADFGKIHWKLHPKMDLRLWNLNSVLKLKDEKRYKIGRACRTSILHWRMSTANEDTVPLSLDYWPEIELGKIHVTLQYTILLGEGQHIEDCMVTLPLPTSMVGRDCELDVESIDGSFNYDKRNGELNWLINSAIDGSGKERPLNEGDMGMFEFRVQPGGGHRRDPDLDALWPVSVNFNVHGSLFSGLHVAKVISHDGFESKKISGDVSALDDYEHDIVYSCVASSFTIGAKSVSSSD